MLDDAIYAWKTGTFEGDNVFSAEDPGGPTFFGKSLGDAKPATGPTNLTPDEEVAPQSGEPETAADAGIRIDLSRIGGQK